MKFTQRVKVATDALFQKGLFSSTGRFFGDFAPDGFSWYGYVPTSAATPNGASIDIIWDALNCGTVFAALDATSKAIAQLPLRVMEWDPDKSEYCLPTGMNRQAARIATERLKRPNDRQTRYQFMYNLSFVLRAWGNAFVAAKSIDGVVPRMVLINPYRMRPITITQNGITRIDRYDFISEAGYNQFSPSEIFQLRDAEIDGITGESIILRNTDKIRLLIQADNFALRTFSNGARISGIYKSPLMNGMTDQKERDQFLEDIRKNFRLDPNNYNNQTAGGIFVTGDEKAELILTEMLSNPQTSDLLNFRKQLINELAASFGVPTSKLGSENAKFNNVAQLNASWFRDTLNPIVENIEQTLSTILIPPEKRDVLYIKADDTAYLKGDLSSQSAFITQLASTGCFKINEIRAHLNFPAIDGGDELAQGKAPDKGKDGEPVEPAQSTETAKSEMPNAHMRVV